MSLSQHQIESIATDVANLGDALKELEFTVLEIQRMVTAAMPAIVTANAEVT